MAPARKRSPYSKRYTSQEAQNHSYISLLYLLQATAAAATAIGITSSLSLININLNSNADLAPQFTHIFNHNYIAKLHMD